MIGINNKYFSVNSQYKQCSTQKHKPHLYVQTCTTYKYTYILLLLAEGSVRLLVHFLSALGKASAGELKD